MFAIRRFQCLADQVWVLLVAVRDQVPITDRLFFCHSLSRVRVHVCWLRGVPCNIAAGLRCRGSNALFQRSRLLQQLLCHVEACFEGAWSYVHLVFFCFRGACAVVTQISC